MKDSLGLSRTQMTDAFPTMPRATSLRQAPFRFSQSSLEEQLPQSSIWRRLDRSVDTGCRKGQREKVEYGVPL
ncbi:hypothetical protein CLAIMM_01893 [Cladophialophora immunda]|nr:hypothetical protein CLAIMM_01893 [Cladophialophora immunda]